jgi:hypothetical protein
MDTNNKGARMTFNGKYFFQAFIGLTAGVMLNAQAGTFPPNCEPVNFSFSEQRVLFNTQNPEGQHLYLLFNGGDEEIILSHKNKNTFVDIGWQTTLQPERWSAFAVNEINYPVTCEVDNPTLAANPCQALRICELLKAKFALSNQGSYWVAENGGLRLILGQIRKKGIVANSSWR